MHVGVWGSMVWQVANYSGVCLFTTTALDSSHLLLLSFKRVDAHVRYTLFSLSLPPPFLALSTSHSAAVFPLGPFCVWIDRQPSLVSSLLWIIIIAGTN